MTEEPKKVRVRPVRRGDPARTVEAREGQLVELATRLAEKQLLEGTASSQVITHYLKMGSTTERLAREKLRKENELLNAKTEQLKSQKAMEEVYAEALRAMTRYSGMSTDNSEGDALDD